MKRKTKRDDLFFYVVTVENATSPSLRQIKVIASDSASAAEQVLALFPKAEIGEIDREDI